MQQNILGLLNQITLEQITLMITIIEDGEVVERILVEESSFLGGGFLEERKNQDLFYRIRLVGQELIQNNRRAALFDYTEYKKRLRVTVEILQPKRGVVVFGAGHVGQAVALISAMIGYETTVVDDRQEFLNLSRFPDRRIQLVCANFEDVIPQLVMRSGMAIVIVTRGHQFDEICLKAVLKANVLNFRTGYVGMIGSKRRVLSVFEKLRQEGFSHDELKRVNAPIGLKIDARSPQEIAVAILAEIICRLNGGDCELR